MAERYNSAFLLRRLIGLSLRQAAPRRAPKSRLGDPGRIEIVWRGEWQTGSHAAWQVRPCVFHVDGAFLPGFEERRPYVVGGCRSPLERLMHLSVAKEAACLMVRSWLAEQDARSALQARMPSNP